MNWKERIINTIQGKSVDFLPFAPRLDIWYQFNKLNNRLPEKYKNCTLREIIKDMDIGFHTVVPDFRNFRCKESIGFLGLGIYDLKDNPYKINADYIDYKFKTDKDGITTTNFKTPYGVITTRTLYSDRMRSDGSSIGHTIEHAVKNLSDLKAIGYIFEKIEIEDNYRNFLDFKTSIGNDGIIVAFSMLSGSPMHHIMKELIPFEKFIYMLNDNLKELENLTEKIEFLFNKVISVSAGSKADAIFLGANYDSFLTWPPFFKKYITPYLKKCSNIVHKADKFFITHADGENEGLIQEYINADIDIADSICPYPMTKLKIKDIRRIFDGKITIWGGLPSICVLEESMSDYEFDKFLDNFFNDIEKGDRLILSFADTTPPTAKLERIEKVARMSRSFKI
jgi:hypothetical protein